MAQNQQRINLCEERVFFRDSSQLQTENLTNPSPIFLYANYPCLKEYLLFYLLCYLRKKNILKLE